MPDDSFYKRAEALRQQRLRNLHVKKSKAMSPTELKLYNLNATVNRLSEELSSMQKQLAEEKIERLNQNYETNQQFERFEKILINAIRNHEKDSFDSTYKVMDYQEIFMQIFREFQEIRHKMGMQKSEFDLYKPDIRFLHDMNNYSASDIAEE